MHPRPGIARGRLRRLIGHTGVEFHEVVAIGMIVGQRHKLHGLLRMRVEHSRNHVRNVVAPFHFLLEGQDNRLNTLLELLVEQDLSRDDLQHGLQVAHRDYFSKTYLNPSIELGFVERTIPDKPTSRLQKYRLTKKGRQQLKTTSLK